MRQIWITRAGPPEVLQVREAADPAPKPGEVRIRVEASGVNFADIMGRMGVYPDLPPVPVVPGYEVSGRIDAVASGVDESWIGKDVIAMTRFGGYADVVCVPVKQIFLQPAGLSALEGAAIPVNYFTAWQLVVVMGALKANETVLIHSVGGGVGIAATQIAKHIGARVIGTASVGKHDEMRALGVDHLIDYRTEDFEKRTRDITAGRGVELILDAVGGESWKKGYRVLAATGRLGMFGVSSLASGKERNILSMLSMLANIPWFQFNPLGLMNANKGVFGVNVGHMWDEIDRLRGWGEALMELAARGIIRPKVAATFKFDDAPKAYHFIQDRRNIGKVLLVP
ncbi:MAG: zinc-binding dehydrogenase [Bradyrhizobium sp.]|uniref:zinc-binding dehydrogenase n=1 Tax=Bradyrhizobium sp. TaxID=376 RepID=UPI003C77EDF0